MMLQTYEVVWLGSTSRYGNATHRDRVLSRSVRAAAGFIVKQNPDTMVELIACFVESKNHYPFNRRHAAKPASYR